MLKFSIYFLSTTSEVVSSSLLGYLREGSVLALKHCADNIYNEITKHDMRLNMNHIIIKSPFMHWWWSVLTFHGWLICLIWTWKSKEVINLERGLPALHDIKVSLAVVLTSGTPGGFILTAYIKSCMRNM